MDFIEESNRIYCKDSQGKVIAEVTFPDIRYHVVNLDHTFVDDSLRGQGVAGKLMEEAVRKIFEGAKIEKMREQEPEYICNCTH
mgnify:CR=1 FL=1